MIPTRTLSPPDRRSGFTLVELLISLAVGLLVVASLYAAFRAAIRTMSYSFALSNENAILRNGFVAVLNESDFWTAHDFPQAALPPAQASLDPAEPTTGGIGDRLTADATARRRSNGVGATLNPAGAPFTRFADTRAATCYITGIGAVDPWTGGRPWAPMLIRNGRGSPAPGLPAPPPTARPQEFERGWDPRYHWAVADPRTWSWTCGVEFQPNDDGDPDPRGDQRYGLYARFSSPFTQVTAPDGVYVTGGSYGDLTPTHHWLPNQIIGLKGSLGDFGAGEYLPAHIPIQFYGLYPGSLKVARPYIGVSTGVARAMPANSFYTSTSVSTLDFLGRIHFVRNTANNMIFGGHGSSRNVQGTIALFNDYQVTRPLFFQKPPKWPDVHSSVLRYVGPGRVGALSTISWTSLVQNESARVNVMLFGTTLRGARQQRHRDGGWALWLANQDELATGTIQHQTGSSSTTWWYRTWTGTPRAAGSRVVGYFLKRTSAADLSRDEPVDLADDLGLDAGFTIPAQGNDPTLDDY